MVYLLSVVSLQLHVIASAVDCIFVEWNVKLCLLAHSVFV